MRRGHWPDHLPSLCILGWFVGVPQLDAESLNLALSGQQTGAQLHHHILVVHHLHPGDILLHSIGLELILLPIRQEAVDGVLQSTLVAMDP
jgi:hypothetical protein